MYMLAVLIKMYIQLEIISAYNLQSISAWAERVWPRETNSMPCVQSVLIDFSQYVCKRTSCIYITAGECT